MTSQGTTATTAAVPTSTGDTGSGGESGTDSSAAETSGTSTTADPSSSTEPTTTGSTTAADTDAGTTGQACNDGGGGVVEFSYLWVANTDQGSISKINTLTVTEEARYWSDPVQSGDADPSRTSVNLTGRSVVVSNRGAGTITKIATTTQDCIDKNGNGLIDTSPNKDTLLDYDKEECVLWTTKVNEPFSEGSGPRSTAFGIPTFNQDTCEYEDEKVWVGYLVAPGQAQMARLDSVTGAIEETVDLPDWPVDEDAPNGYAPYGAAIDPQGYVWTTAVHSNTAYRIDPVTLDVELFEGPELDRHYGMAFDPEGRLWFSNWGGHGGISMFDPANESWSVIPDSQGNVYRGIGTDSLGNVWASANEGGEFGCGLLQIDADAEAIVEFHIFDPCGTPLGVGVDLEKKVWMIDFEGWAYQIDPNTYDQTFLQIDNLHYTYSDMTGSGLVGVTPG